MGCPAIWWIPGLNFSVLAIDDFHDVYKWALDDLQEGLIEFEGFIVADVYTFLLIVPLYELVVGFQLGNILLPKPLPHFYQL